jgi:hypothetical protein
MRHVPRTARPPGGHLLALRGAMAIGRGAGCPDIARDLRRRARGGCRRDWSPARRRRPHPSSRRDRGGRRAGPLDGRGRQPRPRARCAGRGGLHADMKATAAASIAAGHAADSASGASWVTQANSLSRPHAFQTHRSEGLRDLKGKGRARASAVVRLAAAREALSRAEKRQADARGTPAEWSTLHRVSEAAAELASREQWLHWIDRGTSLRPEADGDWGRLPTTRNHRSPLGAGHVPDPAVGPSHRPPRQPALADGPTSSPVSRSPRTPGTAR